MLLNCEKYGLKIKPTSKYITYMAPQIPPIAPTGIEITPPKFIPKIPPIPMIRIIFATSSRT
jgi:hypothetical protein